MSHDEIMTSNRSHVLGHSRIEWRGQQLRAHCGTFQDMRGDATLLDWRLRSHAREGSEGKRALAGCLMRKRQSGWRDSLVWRRKLSSPPQSGARRWGGLVATVPLPTRKQQVSGLWKTVRELVVPSHFTKATSASRLRKKPFAARWRHLQSRMSVAATAEAQRREAMSTGAKAGSGKIAGRQGS